jgi:multisubunit Na+/H+ antiporter MnhB subunit
MQGAGSAGRPTRLGRGFLILAGLTFLLEFVTGIALWRVHEWLEQGMQPPDWNGWVRALHGVLTPVLSAQFGYLFFTHIPGGWKLRANRVSGVLMTVGLGLLFASAMGIYYSNAKHLYASVHITTGFLLPFFLGWHIFSGYRWAKK